MTDFKNRIDRNSFQKELKDDILRVALDKTKQTSPEECCYDLIFCVSCNEKVTYGVELAQFEDGKYVAFTIPHIKEAI